MLALRRPEQFATFGDFGGLLGPRTGDGNEVGSTVKDLFGGSQEAFEAHEPEHLLRSRRYPGMGAWFESAADDPAPLAAARRLAPEARAAGIDTCLAVAPSGDHSFGAWAQAFKDSLPWMAARLGVAPPSPDQTQLCRPA
jgi:S-formylglutathione hydrolase FrmB